MSKIAEFGKKTQGILGVNACLVTLHFIPWNKC
jgi:hypothetical protein